MLRWWYRPDIQEDIDNFIDKLKNKESIDTLYDYFSNTFFDYQADKRLNLLMCQLIPRLGSTNGELDLVYQLFHYCDLARVVETKLCMLFDVITKHYHMSGEFILFVDIDTINSPDILNQIVNIYPEYLATAAPSRLITEINDSKLIVPTAITTDMSLWDKIEVYINRQIVKCLNSTSLSNFHVKTLSTLHPYFWGYNDNTQLPKSILFLYRILDKRLFSAERNHIKSFKGAEDTDDGDEYIDNLPVFLFDYVKHFSDFELLIVIRNLLLGNTLTPDYDIALCKALMTLLPRKVFDQELVKTIILDVVNIEEYQMIYSMLVIKKNDS